MIFSIEPVAQAYSQLDGLLQDYFARTKAKEGLPPLHMQWRTYIELEKAGSLMVLTARDDKCELLGFVMYHIYQHLHHTGVINAACDILAVRLDQRNKGIGRALVENAEPLLRSRGAQFVTHQFRTCYEEEEPLFPKLGYKLIEQGYLKELS
jgi:GNAT superfamily N-acetyltransferase